MQKLASLILTVTLAHSAFASVDPAQVKVDALAALAEGKAIYSKTFDAAATPGWARDSTEVEALLGVACEKSSLSQTEVQRELFLKLYANNWKEFRHMTNCPDCLGLYTTQPSTLSWDESSHAVREMQKWVWFYPSDAVQGIAPNQTFNFGSDLMDDLYFDDAEFRLFQNQYVLRARKRWDSWQPGDRQGMRRLLVGLKHMLPINPTSGFKDDEKMDERYDEPSQEAIEGLHEVVPQGFSTWNGSKAPIGPVSRVYRSLADKKLLPDYDTYEQVLHLKPQIFLRSLRRRFHMSELGYSELFPFYERGRILINEFTARANDALAANPDPATQKALQKMLAEGASLAALIDNSDTRLQIAELSEISKTNRADAAPGPSGG